MRRTLAIQATVANEAVPARPSENALNQIPPSSSDISASPSSSSSQATSGSSFSISGLGGG